MSIQSNLNQSLTILGALATQSPELKQMAENRQLNKEYKNLENQSSNIREAVTKGLPEMEKAAINLDEKGFKTATEKFNIGVSDLEDIAKQKKDLAIKLGKSEDYSKNVGEITDLNRFKESSKENLNLLEKVKKAQKLHESQVMLEKATQETSNKVLNNHSQKQRMKEMKEAVKSIKKENLRNDLSKNKDIRTGKEDSRNG